MTRLKETMLFTGGILLNVLIGVARGLIVMMPVTMFIGFLLTFLPDDE